MPDPERDPETMPTTPNWQSYVSCTQDMVQDDTF